MGTDDEKSDSPPDLETIFQEIAKEVYVACAANEMLNLIGNHADQINSHGFGNFFGQLQSILTNQFISSMTKVFEKPRNFALYSIPQALKEMEGREINDCAYLRGGLEACGLPRAKFEHLSDKELAAWAIRIASTRQPHSTIKKLKALRNKKVAHNEAIPLDEVEKPIWEEAEQALEFATKFIAIGGNSYFNIVFGDQNYNFCYEYDAKSLSANLSKLLRTAGIAKDDEGSEG